jgi:hypothetical protein
MLPALGIEWNAMGSTTHNAMLTAVTTDFFTFVILPPKNKYRGTSKNFSF